MLKVFKYFQITNICKLDGFIATTAIILLTSGSLAFIIAVLSTVTIYSDSINKREERIQNRFNLQACEKTIEIMKIKDYFLSGEIEIKEFDCNIQI